MTDEELAALLRSNDLLEVVSETVHDQWSTWQRYLHSRCTRNSDGSLTIPPELVERWERQIATMYHNLSELEKDSDRRSARVYIETFSDFLLNAEFIQTDE